MNVIARATGQLAVPGDRAPVLAAIIRAPQRSIAVGLDQRIHTAGVGWSDCYIDLAYRLRGQAMCRNTLPVLATIMRDKHAAPGTATVFAPGIHLDLPGSGEDRPGILRVHRQAGATGIRVDKQLMLPGLATIAGMIDATLLLRRRQATERADINAVGVCGIYQDATDAAAVLQPHVGPGLASIS